MTLLHCDGFDAQTALVGGAYIVQKGLLSKLSYITGRTGSGSALTQAVGTAAQDGCVISVKIPTATTVIIGIAMKNGDGSGSDGAVIEWRSGGVSGARLKVIPANGSPAGQASFWRSTSWGTSQTAIGAASPVVVPTSTWQYVEVKVVSSTTSGSITLKQDGVQTFTIAGINTGSANIDEIVLSTAMWDANNPYGHRMSYDDWYICDTNGTVNNDFLGDIQVLSILPNNNGTSSQMTGSDSNSTDNYLLVDEVPPATVDYVLGATAGLKDTYAYQDLGSTYAIKGVQVHSYVGKLTPGPLNGRAVALSGGTTATSADHAIPATGAVWRDTFETNPNTSTAWTPTTLNAAEFGWEVRT